MALDITLSTNSSYCLLLYPIHVNFLKGFSVFMLKSLAIAFNQVRGCPPWSFLNFFDASGRAFLAVALSDVIAKLG